MNNNQVNNKNTVYQYNVTTGCPITPVIAPKTPPVRPTIQKVRFEPALERAKRALRLVNPFKGV